MPLSNVTPMFHWPVPSPEEILLISHVVTNRQSIKNKRPNKLEKSLTINNLLLIVLIPGENRDMKQLKVHHVYRSLILFYRHA